MDTYNSISICHIAASIARALGARPPEHAAKPLNALSTLLKKGCGCETADRVLMYNPDAIAMWLFQKYTDYFLPVLEHTQLALPLRTVMPSVTPVCFGSLYTGAMPHVHGIQEYVKPVIKIDSLFDTVLRSGKRAAIVAVGKASMSNIYLERDMDYYICGNNAEVNEKALDLIREDRHDLLVVYNGNYDSASHKTYPESELALNALKDNINTFAGFAEAVDKYWKRHNVLLGFATDHGTHKSEEGNGAHGSDLPEDLNIMHFYGVKPKS